MPARLKTEHCFSPSETDRIRTDAFHRDRVVLWPLSYCPKDACLGEYGAGEPFMPATSARVFPESEWRVSNSRPPGPKPGALPTAPHSEVPAAGPRAGSRASDLGERICPSTASGIRTRSLLLERQVS